jgi:hypothetical protein
MEDYPMRMPGIPNCYVWACLTVPPTEYFRTKAMDVTVAISYNTVYQSTHIAYLDAQNEDVTQCPEALLGFENWTPDSDSPGRFQLEQAIPEHDASIAIDAITSRPTGPMDIEALDGELGGEIPFSAIGPAALNIGPSASVVGGEWDGVGLGTWTGVAPIEAGCAGDIGPLEGTLTLTGECHFPATTIQTPDYATGDLNGNIHFNDLLTGISAPKDEQPAIRMKPRELRTKRAQTKLEGMTMSPRAAESICIFTLGIAPNAGLVPTGFVTKPSHPGEFARAFLGRDWLVLDQKTCHLPGEAKLSQRGNLHLHRDSVVFLHCQINSLDDKTTQLTVAATFAVC